MTPAEESETDCQLIVDALASYVGPEIETDRDRRAWELIELLSSDSG